MSEGYKILTDEVSSCSLEEGDSTALCKGYTTSVPKTILYIYLCVISGGTLLLICYWKPAWRVLLTCSPCQLRTCRYVIIYNQNNQYVHKIQTINAEDCFESINDLYGESYQGTSEALGRYQNGGGDGGRFEPNNILFHRNRYFTHCHLRYYWNAKDDKFIQIKGLDNIPANSPLLQPQRCGLTPQQRDSKRHIYGENSIDIEVKGYLKLFVEEILNPFYIFQICSMILWGLEDYYYYASAIFVISAISLGISLYETRKQAITLRNMVATVANATVISSNGSLKKMDSLYLIPGDIIVIPPDGCLMNCDAALLTGNCIANESMLTGESLPVTKTPVHLTNNEIFSIDHHKRHILFSGTKIIQSRYHEAIGEYVKAVVIRTSFSTSKGQLVRSILFPNSQNFQFYNDALRFVGVLACLACVGFIYTIVISVESGLSEKSFLLKAFDIVTVIVPPALPAAMTVGTIYAQSRLKAQKIYCTSPATINICGGVDMFCFDKTGTLTEDELDMDCVIPVDNATIKSPEINIPNLDKHPLLIAMATCHSLTIINGELVGDTLDLKMFESTNWLLEEHGKDSHKYNSLVPTIVRPMTSKEGFTESYSDVSSASSDYIPYEVGILKQFPFSSLLQRMTVVTRTLSTNHMNVFTKGAPEKIVSLCSTKSIPYNFHEVLDEYSGKGFRILGVCYRKLESNISWHQMHKSPRDKLEREMTFLGFIVMQNVLKPGTADVINTLKVANIRVIMITGDNISTGVAVARDCGMLDPEETLVTVEALSPSDTVHKEPSLQFKTATHVESNHYSLGITGHSFYNLQTYFPEVVPLLLSKGLVYARMSPSQKTQLIKLLQERGYCAGMCGDGANDCGALRAANVGVSLSEAEASVASPFTSREPDIGCVTKLIREGRCSLATSFSMFKYMALYSFIQFVSLLILYWIESNFGDWQFLYIDLIITTAIAIFMSKTDPYPKLVARQLPKGLFHVTIIASVVLQVILQAAIQTLAYFILQSEPWFTPLKPNPKLDNIVCYETTVIFTLSAFQYVVVALVFSSGKPYRKPMYSNIPFLVVMIFLTSFNLLILFYWMPWVSDKVLQLVNIPSTKFRIIILGLVLCHVLASHLIENLANSDKFYEFCLSFVTQKSLTHQTQTLPTLNVEFKPNQIDGQSFYVSI